MQDSPVYLKVILLELIYEHSHRCLEHVNIAIDKPFEPLWCIIPDQCNMANYAKEAVSGNVKV